MFFVNYFSELWNELWKTIDTYYLFNLIRNYKKAYKIYSTDIST